MPLGLHLNMFTKMIEIMGTDEQQAKWLPLCKGLRMFGCYAQTEIGHGSNVAGLETTATFDEKADEFVIHTPTSTATKWWPGEMGTVADHAVVFAQLVLDGNDMGPAPFIVRIREPGTHAHCKGIESGDMGPKFGWNSKENGWLTFDQVRIPRSHLLSRYISVDREGSFSIEGDLRALYATMMGIRSLIVEQAPYTLTLAALVGIRYSIVRRQFKNTAGSREETKLLDYQTQ